ncbi:MAG: hypothetical protein JWP35_4428 [Caulobacter sp.]|jgi:hypothetical protein|nr:hypothetical protein [Caulobacter sp.]
MDKALVSLRERFRQRCFDDLSLLRAGMAEPVAMTERRFQTMIHHLSGTAGVLGFGQMGDLAREIDDVLSDGGDVRPAQLRSLEAALEAAALPPGQPAS